MSEEEKRAIEDIQCLCTDDCINHDIVDTVVKLVKRQQKEIEKLKEEKNKLVNPSDLLLSYYDVKGKTYVRLNGFISKDKIKEKIEELEEHKEVYEENKWQINILEELLGDE